MSGLDDVLRLPFMTGARCACALRVLGRWPSLSALAALGLTLLRVPCPAESLQSCLTQGFLDRSQPGSSVHGALQTRILEWVAVPS